jgi:hypothetical protein
MFRIPPLDGDFSMKRFALVLVAVAVAAPTVSFGDQPAWPAGAQKKDDPRVLAFYDGMCALWADQNGLTGEQRDAYLTKCRMDASAVFPVGYVEEDSGGGE